MNLIRLHSIKETSWNIATVTVAGASSAANGAPTVAQAADASPPSVNGKTVNLASYQVKAGDNIQLSERAQKHLNVTEALNLSQQMDLIPGWCEVDAKKFSGVFKSVPDRADLPSDINEALIVELYSK